MADRVEDRPSLKDLDGVRVAVDEPVPPPLSRDTLRADVERVILPFPRINA